MWSGRGKLKTTELPLPGWVRAGLLPCPRYIFSPFLSVYKAEIIFYSKFSWLEKFHIVVFRLIILTSRLLCLAISGRVPTTTRGCIYRWLLSRGQLTKCRLNILNPWNAFQELGQFEQITIRRITEPRGNRDCIFRLEDVGHRTVVNDYGTREVSSEPGEIFDVVVVY